MVAALIRWRPSLKFLVRCAGPTDWAVLGTGAAAWVALPWMPAPTWLGLCVGSTAPLERIEAHLSASSMSGDLGAAAAHWFAMIAAMMTPLVVEPLRHVVFRSLRQRRFRAVSGFLSAYFCTWVGAGVVLMGVLLVARAYLVPMAGLGIPLGCAAVLWQLSPARREALRTCHRQPPLRLRGRGADHDCAAYGSRQGVVCVATCGPAMVALMMSPFAISASAVAGVMLFMERGTLAPSPQPLAALLVLLVGIELAM